MCPFWLFWLKNSWPWFTWWFNHLPKPSISSKWTPITPRLSRLGSRGEYGTLLALAFCILGMGRKGGAFARGEDS